MSLRTYLRVNTLNKTNGHRTRALATLVDAKGRTPPRDFKILPGFFTLQEQRILLETALHKLDSTEGRQFRRRRTAFFQDRNKEMSDRSSDLQSLFAPDGYYQMEEGHYDGVIRHFREMHVSSWPESDIPGLFALLERLRSLCPTQDTQTHLLHLASDGEILPHIDNVGASGSFILGVSLGADRVMRMEAVDNTEDSFDVLLESGSVYIQRDVIRYGYNHSILREGSFRGRHINGGPRVSIMIRDHLSTEGPS